MKNKINMFIVYITEAHASDIWNIGESAGEIVESHKNINDRINCINNLQNKFDLSIPVYADNMNNQFETLYASWPFRYYVIKNNKFIKIGTPDDSQFDICELIQFINQNI